MTEETNKKTNFFKDILKSIKDLDKYEDYALELPQNAFKYLFKLVLLFSAIICVCYTYQIVQNMNDIYEKFKSTLPDFSYAQGTLTVDSKEPIVIEDINYKNCNKLVIAKNTVKHQGTQTIQVGILLINRKAEVL